MGDFFRGAVELIQVVLHKGKKLEAKTARDYLNEDINIGNLCLVVYQSKVTTPEDQADPVAVSKELIRTNKDSAGPIGDLVRTLRDLRTNSASQNLRDQAGECWAEWRLSRPSQRSCRCLRRWRQA